MYILQPKRRLIFYGYQVLTMFSIIFVVDDLFLSLSSHNQLPFCFESFVFLSFVLVTFEIPMDEV